MTICWRDLQGRSLRVAVAGLLLSLPVAAQGTRYYPDRHPAWEHRSPAQVGMHAARLDSAIAFARANESTAPRDLASEHAARADREPHGNAIGPFAPRGDMTGVILRHGYIVAEWGEPDRVDMTFSATKSFLSTTIGLAFDRGLIASLDDTVRHVVPTGEFDSPHNHRISWDHLLRQTSDWEGTLWDKPDWADRPPANQTLEQYQARPRAAPGTTYKYNDVRVNALAYAGLMLWRKPLPQVLRELIMDPIGASPTWRWLGYDNSWINVDGQMVQSVSGGGHWGGGMFISAHDLARFGLLTLRRGLWKNQQLISERWVSLALTPTPAKPSYGFMNWFLNPGGRQWPSAPASTFCHLGGGTNLVCVLPRHDLVVVARWIDRAAIDGLLGRVIGAVPDP